MTFTCPSCEQETELDAAHYRPAFRAGSFSDSEPEEIDIVPEQCPECGRNWVDEVIDAILDNSHRSRDDYE